RRELSLKGVERAIVDDVLEERRSSVGTDGDGDGGGVDLIAAGRLLERHARALARVTDPRQRRQRAYGLLARNGFDPEACRDAASAFMAAALAADVAADDPENPGDAAP
ncbi:MAG: RecX family transcriptional regulator, partial [Candidatus Limnocylindrales bacterium]